jgi:hypothetical protein
MREISSVAGFVAVVLLLGCAQRADRPLPDGTALADFDHRVNAYAALRDNLETGAAKLDETAKPEDLVAAELALAARIQRARATARRGGVFTPADLEKELSASTSDWKMAFFHHPLYSEGRHGSDIFLITTVRLNSLNGWARDLRSPPVTERDKSVRLHAARLVVVLCCPDVSRGVCMGASPSAAAAFHHCYR